MCRTDWQEWVINYIILHNCAIDVDLCLNTGSSKFEWNHKTFLIFSRSACCIDLFNFTYMSSHLHFHSDWTINLFKKLLCHMSVWKETHTHIFCCFLVAQTVSVNTSCCDELVPADSPAALRVSPQTGGDKLTQTFQKKGSHSETNERSDTVWTAADTFLGIQRMRAEIISQMTQRPAVKQVLDLK